MQITGGMHMRKYIMVVFNLFLGVFMYISCTSINKSNETGIKISNEDKEEIIMEELEYDLETIEKMNSRFSFPPKIDIELTNDYMINITYLNDTSEVILVPYFSFDVIYVVNRHGRYAVNYGTLCITDSKGNELLGYVMIDRNPYYIIKDEDCLKMGSGDKYTVGPIPLDKLINIDELKGTGTVISIFYGVPEYIVSNIITLTL